MEKFELNVVGPHGMLLSKRMTSSDCHFRKDTWKVEHWALGFRQPGTLFYGDHVVSVLSICDFPSNSQSVTD